MSLPSNAVQAVHNRLQALKGRYLVTQAQERCGTRSCIAWRIEEEQTGRVWTLVYNSSAQAILHDGRLLTDAMIAKDQRICSHLHAITNALGKGRFIDAEGFLAFRMDDHELPCHGRVFRIVLPVPPRTVHEVPTVGIVTQRRQAVQAFRDVVRDASLSGN